MKRQRILILLAATLFVGQSFLPSPAHAIWRSIAVTHSTATLMQILLWGPNVEQWKLKASAVPTKEQARRLSILSMTPPRPAVDTPIKLSPAMRRKIVLTVGAIESRLAFGIINNRPAGGGIAYGYLQVLSRHGGLHNLLKLYASLGGKHGKALLSFGRSTSERVARHPGFQYLLRQAGKDPLMQRAQTLYFSREYFRPTLEFGRSLNLREPASYLLLFDAFIHYGNKKWLRNMIAKWVRKDGEHKALIQFLSWMRTNLYKAYTRSYGRNSLQVRYNAWRAAFLQYIWLYQTKLQGPVKVKAPQWHKPLIIK